MGQRIAIRTLALAGLAVCALVGGDAVADAESDIGRRLRFITMYAKDGAQRLKMECEGTPPFQQITCRSHSVTVSKPDWAAHEKERDEALAEIKRDFKQMRAELRKARANLATSKTRDGVRDIENGTGIWEGQPDGRRTFALRAIQDWSRLAACTDAACAEQAVLEMYARKPPCTVGTFESNPIEYQRSGSRTWVYNLPTCATLVTTGVLELDKNGYDWTFTQTRQGSIDPDDPICKLYDVNKTSVWSSKYKGDSMMECDSITFGP